MKNTLVWLLMIVSFSAMAQPSKDQVIARMKKANPKIYKVVCSEPEKRLDGGTYKWFFGTRSYINTETPGISRVYSGVQRYVGTTFEKSLLGTDYYTGIPDPNMDDIMAIVKEFNIDFLGTRFDRMVGTEVPQYKPVEGEEFYWDGMNYVRILFEVTYQEKIKDLDRGGIMSLETIREVREVSFSRSVDGIGWDPKAPMLKDGIWIKRSMAPANIQKSREVIETKPLTEEEYDSYRYVMYADEPSYNVGDRIEGIFGQTWYGGTVARVKTKDNTYYVHFDDGDKQWMPTDRMRMEE